MENKEQMELRKKLYAKVNAIGLELGQVKADGHNSFSNYNYISYEQVNARLRNLLPKHNLSISPSVIECQETQIPSGNKVAVRTIVKMNFTLTDLETGYSEDKLWYGADMDTGGKSFGQAVTESQKRFELKLFHISTQADADPDSKTTVVTAEDGVTWMSKHKELVDLAKVKKLTRADIENIVNQGGRSIEKVKELMMAI